MGLLGAFIWSVNGLTRDAARIARAIERSQRASARRDALVARQRHQQAQVQARRDALVAPEQQHEAQLQSCRERLDAHKRVVDQALSRYFTDLASTTYSPRLPGQDAKLPSSAVKGMSSDQVGLLFRRAPRRSAICYSAGVWFGWYESEGKVWFLLERSGHLQKFLTSDTREDADAAWDVVTRHCANVHLKKPVIDQAATATTATEPEPTRSCRVCGKPGLISNDTCKKCRKGAAAKPPA